MVVSGSESGSNGTILVNGQMKVDLFAGGMGQTQIMDYPEGALMAEAVRNIQLERGLKEGDKFSTTCFIPSMLTAATVEVETYGQEQVDLFGRIVTATKQKTTTTMQGQVIVTTDYVADDLKVLRSVSSTMGMNIELIACDKIVAMSDNDIYDMLDKMLVQCPTTFAGQKHIEVRNILPCADR